MALNKQCPDPVNEISSYHNIGLKFYFNKDLAASQALSNAVGLYRPANPTINFGSPVSHLILARIEKSRSANHQKG